MAKITPDISTEFTINEGALHSPTIEEVGGLCGPISFPAKIERVEEPPYLSDELVEQIAVLHNGGTWPIHYTEEHREHWRGQAIKIIELVKLYLAHPLYKVTPIKAFINDHLGEPYDPTADDEPDFTPEQMAAADKAFAELKPTKWRANEVAIVAVPSRQLADCDGRLDRGQTGNIDIVKHGGAT